MAEADRTINDILIGEKDQEKQSKRISHYESVKAELMDTLKKIDEEQENAANEMTEVYTKYGVASWDFDTIFEFRDRRKKAWDDYGTFLQEEKASLDKAKQALMEQQEDAEKLAKGIAQVLKDNPELTKYISARATAEPKEVASNRSTSRGNFFHR